MARKPDGRGRPSGGILVLIKKPWDSYFQITESNFKHGLIFDVSKQIHGEDVIFIATYLPPFGASAYGATHDNGVDLLDDELLRLKTRYPGHSLLITGDFNARTQDATDFLIDDRNKYVPLPTNYPIDTFNIPRKSRDTHADINQHGTALLHLCCSHNIHIVNGRVNGDTEGHLTCFTHNGASLVDYTLVSSSIFHSIVNFKIADYDQFTHLPQTFIVETHTVTQMSPNLSNEGTDEQSTKKKTKLKWKQSLHEKAFTHEHVTDIMNKLQNNDINGAVNSFTLMIQSACSKSKITMTNNKNAKWWDAEMEALKQLKSKCLRFLRIENSFYALSKYRNIRKMYKAKIKEKRNNYVNKMHTSIRLCTSGSEFWKIVKSLLGSKQCVNKISSVEWKHYFSTLLNEKHIMDPDFESLVNEYVRNHDETCIECKQGSNLDEVNKSITLTEVENAIKETVSKKAPGCDGITNEILKQCQIVIVPILCEIFNRILQTGVYPDAWGEAIIVPIHKKGDVNNTDNYRGISLLSCTSKIFMKIVNNRLVNWAKVENKICEEQAGFSKGKSTVDQIFLYQSIVTKYLSKQKGRFYSVYVDFSKAFDSVPHSHLFYSLLKGGLHGRVINVIRNMYSKLTSRVQAKELSEAFSCNLGTRQGCMLSPFLFIFYLNELVNMCNDCRGIFIDNEHSVNMLLYADDIVLFSDSVGGVQKLLNVLSEFCLKWGMEVNLDKTKFMVFRNGGIIKNVEKVYYNGVQIEPVTYYKYLGLVVSSRLNWHQAQFTLAQQATKALYCINRLIYECDLPFDHCYELFNKCALPVLTYGSEIWGTKVYQDVESILLKFCKRQLGVGSKTPNPAVLGECGASRIHIECKIKCIKYWLYLLSQPPGSLLRACYDMLYLQCNAGRKNWASDIRDLLNTYGYNYIWNVQMVVNAKHFIAGFRMTLLDCERQNWRENVFSMPRLNVYSMFKLELSVENYLLLDIPRAYKIALAKLRVGNHELEIELGRHQKKNRGNRLCKFCLLNGYNYIEDEYHVLMNCYLYKDLREKYIDAEKLTPRNLYRFNSLFSSKCPVCIIGLAKYTFHMFRYRSCCLNLI